MSACFCGECLPCVNALLAKEVEESLSLHVKLATIESALASCVKAMEMQLGRETETLHIPAATARAIYDETLKKARAALGPQRTP